MCIKALCEYEHGWHPTGANIEYEMLTNVPNSHFAYLIRMLSLIKQSNFDLQIVNNVEKLEEIIGYIEDNLPTMDDLGSAPSLNSYAKNSEIISSNMSTITTSYSLNNFKDSYDSIKNYIMNKLEMFERKRISQNEKELANNNKIELLDLNRCALPNGKILWLCKEHSKEKHVQILTRIEETKVVRYQNDEYYTLLFEQLKKYEKAWN